MYFNFYLYNFSFYVIFFKKNRIKGVSSLKCHSKTGPSVNSGTFICNQSTFVNFWLVVVLILVFSRVLQSASYVDCIHLWRWHRNCVCRTQFTREASDRRRYFQVHSETQGLSCMRYAVQCVPQLEVYLKLPAQFQPLHCYHITFKKKKKKRILETVFSQLYKEPYWLTWLMILSWIDGKMDRVLRYMYNSQKKKF